MHKLMQLLLYPLHLSNLVVKETYQEFSPESKTNIFGNFDGGTLFPLVIVGYYLFI